MRIPYPYSYQSYHSAIASSSASEEGEEQRGQEIFGEFSGPNRFSRTKRTFCATLLTTVFLLAVIKLQQGQWSWSAEQESVSSSSSSNQKSFSMLGMSKSKHGKKHDGDESSSSSRSDHPVILLDPASKTLSKRGRTVHPARDDILLFQMAAADAYDPEENPNGYLVMVIAENNLMYHELASKLQQVMTNATLPRWVFNYGSMHGSQGFRTAVADMMESSWMQAPVSPDDLILQAGAGVVLDNLAWILTDAGDGVLINAPSYAAFPGDFNVHGRAVLHVARTKRENNYEPTIDELDQAYDEAVKAGNDPKFYVICQPNNPVGLVYSHAAMTRMITWALEKDLHVVSDEIYGNSVFPGQSVTSAAQIMREMNPEDEHYLTDKVHIVAGLSKDWGMSGFRVGSLLTHNEALKVAMDTIAYYSAVSEYTQFALTGMLSDLEWRDWYLAENQRRLEETFYAAKDAFDLIGVPIFPSTGALFIWADFSSFLLPGQTEKELWLELFHDTRILFAAGESFFEDKPGLFRVVYPWPVGGVLAMQELGRRLVQWKEDRDGIIL